MLKTVGFPSTRTGDQTIVNGNLVIGTSGNGIDFSATPGTGTSELLNDYEEGTWTPTLNSFSGGTLSPFAYYTKVGRLVYLTIQILNASGGFSSTAGVSTITNLPFTPSGAIGNFGTVTNANAASIAAQDQAGLVISNGTIYPPSFTNTGTQPECIACWYFV